MKRKVGIRVVVEEGGGGMSDFPIAKHLMTLFDKDMTFYLMFLRCLLYIEKI